MQDQADEVSLHVLTLQILVSVGVFVGAATLGDPCSQGTHPNWSQQSHAASGNWLKSLEG